MSAANDFFGYGQSVSIEARDEHGLPAPVAERHSANTIERTLKWLKTSAAPVVTAIAIAGALSMAGAPSAHAHELVIGAQGLSIVHSHQHLHAHSNQAAGKLQATQAANGESKLSSISKLSTGEARAPEEVSAEFVQNQQTVLNLYEKNLNQKNSKFTKNEFGMTQQAVQDLSMSAIAPSARKYVSRLDVIDKDVFGIGEISPSMMSLTGERSKTTCILQLGGYNKEISKIFQSPIEKLSAKDSESLRKVVLIHESAHCEHGALLAAHAAKRETNFAGHMNDVADGFKTNLGTKTIDYSQEAKTLMWERYADSKTVLFFAKTNMGDLTAESTDSERALAIDGFKQDVSMIKKLRINERELSRKNKDGFDDHDTLHIVESLESNAVESAKDPAKWKAWSGKYLGEEQMAPTAGSIALGSLLAERNEISSAMVSTQIGSLKTKIDDEKEYKKSVELQIIPFEKQASNSMEGFESDKKIGSSEHAGFSLAAYIIKSNEARSTKIDSILEARRGMTTGDLTPTDDEVKTVDEYINATFPARYSALEAVSDRESVNAQKEKLSRSDLEISSLSGLLTDIKDVGSSKKPTEQAIGEGLSDASKSFSMKGHAFWIQSKVDAGDAVHKSYLEEGSKSQTPHSSTLSNGFIKMLSGRPMVGPKIGQKPMGLSQPNLGR